MLSFYQISEWAGVCQSPAICSNGFDFCRALICWGNVRGKWLLIFMVVIKMKKCLRVMSLSKLSRFFFCLQIQEHTQLILFLLFIGESYVGFLLGHFTFPRMLHIYFFFQPLCLTQLYDCVLHLSKLSFEPRHIPFVAFHC
jgi:hypothetical protein